MKPITCQDLKDVKGSPTCCSTCHDDDEAGFDGMSGDCDNWRICCAVCLWLEQNGVDVYREADPNHPIVAALSKVL